MKENTSGKYIIRKSEALKGNIRILGSKNSALPIMSACLLTDEQCIVNEVPPLSDVYVMQNILKNVNCEVNFNESENIITLKSHTEIQNNQMDYDLIGEIRASFLIMGPLLARNKYVKIPLPGGCQIGARPVDLHLKGFSAMGATIKNEHGYIIAEAEKLVGSKIYLDFPSVGATENILMAATLAEGTTIIENAAIEPEIVDLANFLNAMGANIKGAGMDTIKIVGVEKLHGTSHTIIPDRIEAGTFMIAAAITKGDVVISNIVQDHLKPIIAKLKELNVNVEEVDCGLRVYHKEESEFTNVDLKTMPYPGFPTDMQAQFMPLLVLAKGTSVVTETIFENRFMQVNELKRMGANIKIDSRTAVIEGINYLMGAQVRATDLRAGAALILAGLVAEGETEIQDVYHIERGYYNITGRLKSLGADIEVIM